MKVELHNLPPELRDDASTQRASSFREVVARLKAVLAEAKEDDEKRKLHFGYFETSEGNL